MGLRNSDMVVNSLAVKTLTITPDTGESIKIKNIFCTPNVAVTEFLTVQVGRMTVGYYHVGSGILNHLPFQSGSVFNMTIMEYLTKAGIDMTIPVAEGESCVISAPNNWTRLVVQYDIYDANDIKSTDINGSASKVYNFLNYGTYNTAITAAGTYELASTHNPVEFPDFPFGQSAPSKTVIELLGVGCPGLVRSGAAFATDDVSLEYLKFFRDREVLFDEDRNGFLIDSDGTVKAANNTTYYTSGHSCIPYGGNGEYRGIKLFENPLSFSGNEELVVQTTWSLAGAGATLAVNSIYCCLVERVTKQ